MTIQVSSPNLPTNGSTVKADRATYLSALTDCRGILTDKAFQPEVLSTLQTIRTQATSEVRSLSMPSKRDEEWRFTDLSPMLEMDFQSPDVMSSSITLDDLASFVLPETSGRRLVFVNGQYAPELSETSNMAADIVATNLTQLEALPNSAELIATYLNSQEGLEKTFTALNTSSFTDAAIVYVGKNVAAELPIHLLFVSTASEQAVISHPRCLIIAEANSEVSFVEDYVAVGDGTYFTNSVTEIWAKENARITHTRLQRDRPTAFHIGKTVVSQAKASHYTCNAINLGGKIFRHNLEVFQAGEATETVLDGLTLITGDQLADTHSLIQYAKPHGTSHQVYKAIVDGHAHSVFNGKVTVPTAAQLTNAAQLNRNLLLSPKGRIDTKPQLEIVADNVKCTHGATVSQLDSDEVFYLQSRGIDAERAQNLLIYAFAAEIIQNLPVPSLRDTLSRFVATMTGSSTTF